LSEPYCRKSSDSVSSRVNTTHFYFHLKSLEPLQFYCKSTAVLNFGRLTT